jgi:hypothetical protein
MGNDFTESQIIVSVYFVGKKKQSMRSLETIVVFVD